MKTLISMTGKFAARFMTCALVATVAVTGYGLSTTQPSISLEQMTREADEIVIGNVLSAETKIVGNHFETDYQIQVHDNLKNRSMGMSAGQTFTFTVPGGALQEPPISQYAMGVPYLYEGEEVFLFLRRGSGKQPKEMATRSPNANRSKLGDTYRVIGANQGHFSVVTRASDGQKFVTRVNLENFGLANTGPALRETIKSIEQGAIPTADRPIVRTKDLASDTRMKDPLEFTASDGRTIKAESYSQRAAENRALRSRVIPVQELGQFRNEVQNFVSTGY